LVVAAKFLVAATKILLVVPTFVAVTNYFFREYHTGKGILLPFIFKNLPNLGTERDTAKEHQMNSMDICSIDLKECFFVVSLPVLKLGLKYMRGNITFATDSTKTKSERP